MKVANQSVVNAKTTALTNDASLDIEASTLNSEQLGVGYEGKGTLIAIAGSVINASQGVNIGDGNNVDGNGVMQLSGQDTQLNSPAIEVGLVGTGKLSLTDKAALQSKQIVIGREYSSNGELTLNGSGTTGTIDDLLIVGSSGAGSLIIENGATLTGLQQGVSVANTASPAYDLNNFIGGITVKDQSSQLNVGGLLQVGDLGQGTLVVEDGGVVNTGDNIIFGRSSSSLGMARITGVGSQLNSSKDITVGSLGSATVDVINGAQVNADGDIIVGESKGQGQGDLNIRNEGSTVEARDLLVGAKGLGTVKITEGAKAIVRRVLQIGGSDTSVDSINAGGIVDINNATVEAPVVVVGAFGSGVLNISDDAILKAQSVERFINSKRSEINFDNGTLQLTDSQPVLFNKFTGDNTIKLGAGGGTIDTAGFNARLFEDSTLAGNGAVISGEGDFTKKGLGLLAMANTAKQWTGDTTISQGTLRLEGDYTMKDGEILGIGLNSLDDYGQLLVQGNLDISQGELQVNASDAVRNLSMDSKWNEVVKGTTRTGEFKAIKDNSPLIAFAADYSDADSVHLSMFEITPTPTPTPTPPVVVDTTFVQSVYSQPNQADLGLAYVLDNAITDRVTTGNNALADALISSTINFNQTQLAVAANQLQPLFMGATNRIITDANYAVSDAIMAHTPTTPERHVWAQIIGNDRSHDGENGITGYESKGYGAIVGIDTPVSNALNLGVAVSYIESDADTEQSYLEHELEAKSWQVLGYGRYAINDATQMNFHAGAGSSDVEGERHIQVLTTNTASSDYSVDTLQAGLGVDYRIGTDLRNISPFAQVNYAQAKSDRYRETGAGVYNLEVEENTYKSLRWTAGLNMFQALTPTLALTGQLAAAVENGDRRSDITASFVGTPDDEFTTIGQEIGQEIGIAGIGLSYAPTANLKISAGYRGEWRDNYEDQGATIALQTTF